MKFLTSLLGAIRPFFLPGKKRSRWRRYLVAPVMWMGLVGAALVFAILVYFQIKAFTFPAAQLEKLPQRTLVFDRKGQPLGHVSGHGENRLVISIDQVSPQFIAALLAREDSRFYQHGGIDYTGLIRAALRNFKAGGFEQGASTLTMQLARNTWGLKQKTLARKIQEMALAKRLEWTLSKDEILEHYLNRIYFGSGFYGIERASQGYFMKSTADLTLGESAMLAGVIRGPSVLNPFRSLDSAKTVRDEVLNRLLAESVITEAEADAAKAEPIALRPAGDRGAVGGYVLQTIHDLLGDLLTEEDIALGGLQITTTIDQEMQTAAEHSLDAHLTKVESGSGFPHPKRSQAGNKGNYVQGAVVSLENRTGAILAMVGGRSFEESQFNRALQAKRQCGSTFKPFVYAVAFDRGGLMPGTWVSDDAINYPVDGGKTWSPGNSDGQFLGNQPAAIGLIRSRNTMSVRVGDIAGLDNVRGLARAMKMGEIPESPVSYLGAFETTPMTLTSAFSTFPAGGVNRAPYLIERIQNTEGEVLFQAQIQGREIFPESVCWLTTDILGEVMKNGTGSSVSQLGYTKPCYGKTGTTNDYRDAWFVGFTDKVTTGVWVGLDQPKKIMSSGYGGSLALPIWVGIMKQAEASGFPSVAMPVPANQQEVTLCRACGGIAGRGSLQPYRMGLPRDLWPRFDCKGHGRGGILDIFTQRDDGRSRDNYPSRDSRDRDGGGLGEVVKGIGRFLFGPSR
ncbi:MAG: penicillin-binding protein [Verrucomicrobiae bacterium]|nr:penicillin-binding protein [Verrucomicrobiae bacterium]